MAKVTHRINLFRLVWAALSAHVLRRAAPAAGGISEENAASLRLLGRRRFLARLGIRIPQEGPLPRVHYKRRAAFHSMRDLAFR